MQANDRSSRRSVRLREFVSERWHVSRYVKLALTGVLALGVVTVAAYLLKGGPGSGRSASPARLVTIPKLHGDETEMSAELYDAGLRIRISRSWGSDSFSSSFPDVISPREGTQVPVGSVVRVEMSAVPGGSWWIPGRYEVPGLLGLTLLHATLILHTHNLDWTVQAAPLPATKTADIFTSYCITRQDPSPGQQIVVTNQVVYVKLVAARCRVAHGGHMSTAS
jgi:hypothetical protein